MMLLCVTAMVFLVFPEGMDLSLSDTTLLRGDDPARNEEADVIPTAESNPERNLDVVCAPR